MNANKILLKTLSLLVCCTLSLILSSQEILVDQVSSNGVCNSFKVGIVLKNTTSEEIVNSPIKLNLPCKIFYINGSINGAQEGGINNLESPEFIVSAIAPNEVKTFTFEVSVPCTVHACNNSGSTNIISATWKAGNTSVSDATEAFNIASPNLLFTAISNVFYELEGQSVFYRELKIKNTRLGKLAFFTISELFNNTKYDLTFDEGIRYDINPGNIDYIFGSETISKFGDGDAFFEYNEEIILLQKITVSACPYEVKQITSKLVLSWGCNMNTCNKEERLCIVKLIPSSTLTDDLQAVSFPQEPDCYLNDEAPQSANFTNASGSTYLTNVKLELKITNGYSWIKPNSVQLNIAASRYSVELKDTSTVQCGKFNKSAIISIPVIKANEEIKINWISSFCDTVLCDNVGSGWKIEYQYSKECSSPADRFHIGTFSHSNNMSLGEAKSEISLEKPNPITTGSSITISHTFQSEELSNNNGAFYLQYTLPCGFMVTSTDFLLNGVPPLSISTIPNDSFSVLKIKYPMPFPTGPHIQQITAEFDCSLLCIEPHCEKEFLGSCPFECKEFTQNIGVQASLIIEKTSNCPTPPLLKASAVDVLNFECDNQICIDSLPGWVSHKAIIYRKNTGFTDDNDDGQPDNNLLTSSPKIKRNHVMVGDTFSLLTTGLISVDFQNERARRLYAEIMIDAVSMTPKDTEYGLSKEFPDLLTSNGLLPNSVNGKLKSNFNNKEYNLTNIPIVLKSQSNFYINLDLDSLIMLNLLPPNFIYETGDSIHLDIEFIVTYNFRSSDYADVLPSVMDINFKTHFGFDDNAFDNEYSSTKCNCQSALLRLSSIQYSTSKFGIYPTSNRFLCNGDVSEFRKFLSSVGVEPGFFPFEYREVYHPDKIVALNDENFSLKNANFTLFDRFNTTVWNKSISDWLINGEVYSYDVPVFKFDEYFKINWQYTAEVTQEMACSTTKAISQEILKADIQLSQGELINKYIDFKHSIQTELLFSVDYPQFKFEVSKDFSESYSDTVSWEFTLSNESNRQPILQPFLYIQPNILFSDIKVIRSSTNSELAPIKPGIYILPDQELGESKYVISGTINSCDRAYLSIRYGWDCDIYDPIGEMPCYSRDKILTGFAPPPVAEIVVDALALSAPLCAPFPFVEVSFVNAGLGSLYDGQFMATLPKGLLYLDNSSEFFDPNTNTFVQINATVVNDFINWNPSNFIGNYLKGNSFSPDNSIKIRFKVTSTCDFTSGSQIVFEMVGKAICGKNINRVKKVTRPLHIENVQSSNPITLNGQINVSDCSNFINLAINIDKTTVTSENILVVTLPQSSTLVSEDSGLAFDISASEILFYLQDEVGQATINIVLSLPDTFGCENGIISIKSISKTNALCLENNESCSIDITDFVLNLPLTVEKASFDINNHKIIHTETSNLTIEYDLLNNSSTIASNAIIQLILDRDNNGKLSAADTILDSSSQSISSGTNNLFIENIQVEDFQLCQLLLVILASNNCICEDLVYPLTNLEITSTIANVCQNTPINIGKDSIPDATYTWVSNQNVPCNTCSAIEITPQMVAFYTLLENYPNGCKVGYKYEVVPRELPQIYTTTATICEGDTLFIFTSSDQVVWNDISILPYGENTFFVVPTQSQIVSATLSDTFGCKKVDTLSIELFQNPIAAIPNQTFCFGQNAQIVNNSLEAYDYFWLENGGRLNNPLLAEPTILYPQSHNYEVEISNGFCSIIDTVNINFVDGLDIEALDDTLLVCFDQTYTLNLPSEYTYQWSPEFNIDCLTPICTEVVIDPLMINTNFVIIGSNSNGCKDTISITLAPSIDDIFINTEVFFCDGDTLFFNDKMIFEPLQICDTTSQDCKIITCTNYLFYQEIDSLYFEKSITEGESIVLNIEETFSLYFWTNAETLSCDDCPNPTANPLQTTSYDVQVTTSDGCTIMLRYKVNVIKDCNESEPLIPNAFTPNANGENDIFRIANYPENASNIHTFRIFNEWGMELFDSKDNSGWDGTFSGDVATPGTYIYVIEIGCDQNETKLYKGGVTLIR